MHSALHEPGFLIQKNEKFGDEYFEGFHVVVWNPDGTVYDYGVYDTQSGDQEDVDNFVYKMGNLTEDGKVVAIAVQEDIGQAQASWEPLYQAIENLGGQDIRAIQVREPYVLVTVTGHPNTAREMRITRTAADDVLEASVSLTLEARNLVFSAESTTVSSGNKHFTRFRVLARRLAFPMVTVLDDVRSWQPGDQVVVASTDYDWRQAEVKTIVECHDCASNQFRVEGEFLHTHFGQVTYGVDERAEVGLLSRNIRIEGEVQDTCYSNSEWEAYLCTRFEMDTFGGHLKVLNDSFARIEGVELFHMGQQSVLARYPLHFHMCDEVPGQYFKNNAIRDSFSRCITIHGTDNATVSDNVCYNHLGHGIFLEDSAERWNIIHRNLVIGTVHGTLIMSDMRSADCEQPDYCNLLSSFWITRPENYITDNVAAGCDGNGFVLAFADAPLGFSFNRQVERGLFQNMSAQYTKVELFSGNVMHSNGDNGLWFDSRISTGQYHNGHYVDPDGVIKTNGLYDPRDPPNENGTRTESILSGLTIYRNDDFDAWIRCGNIVITNSSFADTTTSVASAHSTGETSCDIRHSIFIGETENKGEPFTYTNTSSVYDHLAKEDKPTHNFDRKYSDNRPDAMQSGILFYQGPVYVDNCYFDRFYNWYYNDSFEDTWGFRPVHSSAAISFHRSNHYPLVPRTGVTNLKFGYCDGENNAFRVMNGNTSSPYWSILDGSQLTTFHDYDGSLTGTANTQIVRDRPFFTGPECLSKPEWDMAICPYKYAQLIVRGDGGVLQSSLIEKWPVILTRDEAPEDVLNIQGSQGLKFPVRVHSSYTIRFNTSLGNAPTEVEIKAKYGLESNDVIRLAVCFPKTTTSFKIVSSWPKVNSRTIYPQWVDSLADLDADTTFTAYYWDSTNGYLFFKMSSNATFTNPDQEAAGDLIPEVTVTRLDGGDNPATCDFDVPPYSNSQIPTPSHVSAASCSGPDSPKGLGAPVVEDYANPGPRAETCADCPVQDPVHVSRNSEPRGCFVELSLLNDFTSDLTKLQRSMTPQFCISRCFQREYPFAGLFSSNKCQCAAVVGRNGVHTSSDACQKDCTGDSSQKCGGNSEEYSVFTTGFALPPAPARCGPLSRGVYYQGKCLYLNYVLEDFWSAETTCQSQGGTLSKIDTEEKMRFIETYLLNIDEDVWFGAKAGIDNWHFLDETPVIYTNWRLDPITPQDNRYLYLQEYRRYKWNLSSYDRYKMSLCDLSLEPVPAFTGNCGYKFRGTIFGLSERCFARITNLLTFQDAEFMCKRMFGRMASILDEAEKADIESYLNGINDGERYWVKGNPSMVGNNEAYDEVVARTLIESADTKHYRSLCVLDHEDTDGCPSEWTKDGESCYLNTDLIVTSYSQAAALCNSETTSILTIDSQEESTFIKNFTSGTVWLDLRFNGVLDNVVKSNGEAAPHNFWLNPNYLQTLSQGLCVASDVASEIWLHTPCSEASGHLVVCEAPVTTFKKPEVCPV
ncbi:transmembrane protein 2-like [Plakobranchus ocellatus]|uniref:Transmembrane protein 2-like n=1 Tax=Plakobranchus ocellatus TaxID=259542 RepID=A0AAV4DMU9_9GAST|nr:transmembrane protein 2-like [Plakobranchus ocellatus]